MARSLFRFLIPLAVLTRAASVVLPDGQAVADVGRSGVLRDQHVLPLIRVSGKGSAPGGRLRAVGFATGGSPATATLVETTAG
jgi:hypothetical protein